MIWHEVARFIGLKDTTRVSIVATFAAVELILAAVAVAALGLGLRQLWQWRRGVVGSRDRFLARMCLVAGIGGHMACGSWRWTAAWHVLLSVVLGLAGCLLGLALEMRAGRAERRR
jgi:hypothetical protein